MFVHEQFCLSQRQNQGLLSAQNLQPRVIAFQREKSRLKWRSMTLDIAKNLRRRRTITIQCQDSNGWTITVQCLLMSNFDCFGGRTGFSFFLENLQPRVLAFRRNQSRFKWRSITLDIVKNLRRHRIITIQCQDNNSWTVIVQCLLMINFDCLRGKNGFSILQRTCSLVSQISNETNLASTRFL